MVKLRVADSGLNAIIVLMWSAWYQWCQKLDDIRSNVVFQNDPRLKVTDSQTDKSEGSVVQLGMSEEL